MVTLVSFTVIVIKKNRKISASISSPPPQLKKPASLVFTPDFEVESSEEEQTLKRSKSFKSKQRVV